MSLEKPTKLSRLEPTEQPSKNQQIAVVVVVVVVAALVSIMTTMMLNDLLSIFVVAMMTNEVNRDRRQKRAFAYL